MAMPWLLPLPNAAPADSRLISRPRPELSHTFCTLSVKLGCSINSSAGGTYLETCSLQGITQKKERQELLWQHFFQDPTQWWDNRGDKKSPRHPDFRHKTSKEGLWLNAPHKPDWVGSQLARWDQEDSVVEGLRRRCDQGELREVVDALEILVQEGCHVGESLLYRVLKRCMAEENLILGQRVHAAAVVGGLESNAFLATHVVRMYAGHGKLEDAVQVFSKVTVPDAHLWATVILEHARHGEAVEAISLYRRMRDSALKPDNHIFVAVLKACATAEDLVAGKEVHADLLRSSVRGNVFVSNSLVSMYAKCGSLEDARRVFNSLPRKDVVTWNAMIAGFTKQGHGRDALALYAAMQLEGIQLSDPVTFVCLLKACGSVGDLDQGKQLHAQIRRGGLEANILVGNCLVDMYAKCGSLEDARSVFDALPNRDVVTWNSMITGYTQQGLGRESLALYASMQRQGMSPADIVTLVCLLKACATVGALHQGKQLHAQIREKGLESHVSIGSTLVDMYAKCGSLEVARQLFERLHKKDVVTWNVLLNGYAEHGDSRMAMQCFSEMLQQGVKPDGTSYSCLLVACSHAGLVDEGQRYFNMMQEVHGIVPSDYHHTCMVDLLGRAGQLDEAEDMLKSMCFENDIVGWKALLSACRIHGDLERGRRCFDLLSEREPENASSYVLLANIYAKAGRWKDVDDIESLRKSSGAWKKPAKACIEIDSRVHEFRVGEERSDISSKLQSMNAKLKDEGGHVPNTQLVLKAVSEQEKEDALCGHAEKLALAYGLMNTPDGTTLLVTKNLRMCNDCHSSTKIMSRLEKREIIVRDAHQVHHFLDGSCSCGDRH